MNYYDRSGQPISVFQWVRLSGLDGYYRVAFSEVGSYVVSTVWLGNDHGSLRGGPAIFETMVFTRDDFYNGIPGLCDLDTARYATEAEALVGHEAMVLHVGAIGGDSG